MKDRALQVPTADEIGSLVREMAAAHARMIGYYRDKMGLTPDEAMKRAGEPLDEAYQARLLQGPADQVGWWDLSSLAEHDPDQALVVWEQVKAEARKELETGHSAAKALDWNRGPWERAQFLALRSSFREEWRPQGGIEGALAGC